jgi:hypothetical protein
MYSRSQGPQTVSAHRIPQTPNHRCKPSALFATGLWPHHPCCIAIVSSTSSHHDDAPESHQLTTTRVVLSERTERNAWTERTLIFRELARWATDLAPAADAAAQRYDTMRRCHNPHDEVALAPEGLTYQ